MKTTMLGYFTVTAAALAAGLALSAAPAAAKTVKACQTEWRANKAAMQAAGKTEKAYVADCRGQPATPAAATKQPTEKGDSGHY